MKLSRQPFRRTTNSNKNPTLLVQEGTVKVSAAKGSPTRVGSPTDVTTTRPPWSFPASVISVSEGGDAEVTLGSALALLELEDPNNTTADSDCRPPVTPEKAQPQQLSFRPCGVGDKASFLESVSPPRGMDDEFGRRLALSSAANLLDCDLSSYESPLKSSTLLDRSTLSTSTASPAFHLIMEEGETPEKVPSYCGLMVCHDDHGVPMSAVDLQERIERFLGAPGSDDTEDGGGWQRAWSMGKNDKDDSDGSPTDGKPKQAVDEKEESRYFEYEERDELQRRLQRALVHRIHKKQAAHAGRLKGRTQPFGGSSGPCQRDAHMKQRRARSFQAHPTSRIGMASAPLVLKPSRLPERRGGALAARGPTSGNLLADRGFPLWTCGMHCGTLTDDEVSPVLTSRKRFVGRGNQDSGSRFTCSSGSDDDEDECYDSDPETFTATKVLFHDNKENIPPSDDVGLNPSVTERQVEDDDPSAQVTWEMFNGRFTLVIQQHQTTDALFTLPSEPQPSVAVHAWLERGQQLRSRVLPPTLVWKDIHREEELTSISLLDIVRIFEAELLVSDERIRRHALARTPHTMCLQTLDSTILIEAESQAERDRLVYGLKVVVSRLGSFLLCNDDRLLDEFFVSTPESLMTEGRGAYRYDSEPEDEDSDDDFEMHDV